MMEKTYKGDGSMILKNYRRDYKMVLTTDNKGKQIEKPVYIGTWYQFSDGLTRKERLWAALPAFFMAALYLVQGFFGRESANAFYVVLPYVAGFLPVAFLIAGGYYALLLPKKMTRQQRDQSFLRLRGMALALLVCSGITLVGQVVFLSLSQQRPAGEWVFFLIALAVFAADTAYAKNISKKCKKIEQIPANNCQPDVLKI